jgi:hypothetical protein
MFSHSKGNVVAVADVGSGGVAVAIVAVTANAPLKVLAVRRSVFPQEKRTPEQLNSLVISQLGIVADAAIADHAATHQKAHGTVTSASAVIRTPWTHSSTVRVMTRFEKEKVITQDLINTTAQQALEEEKELDHTKSIETSIVRVELNGYPTAKPVGKSAHQLAVSVLLGDCDTQIKTGVAEQMQRACTVKETLIRSGTQAVLSFLRENNRFPHDCLVMDMSGEATNMIVIRKGISVGHEMVAEGVRSIVARCTLEGLPEESLSLIRMAAHDQCNDTACDTIIAALAKAEPDLVRIFGEALSRLSVQRRIPNTCVLIVDQDIAPWLSQFFARIDFSQFTTTMSPFSVSVLSPQGSAQNLLFEQGVSPDAGIGVVAAIVRR